MQDGSELLAGGPALGVLVMIRQQSPGLTGLPAPQVEGCGTDALLDSNPGNRFTGGAAEAGKNGLPAFRWNGSHGIGLISRSSSAPHLESQLRSLDNYPETGGPDLEEGRTQGPTEGPPEAPHGPFGERLQAERINHVWSYDFLFDRTEWGGRLQWLPVIDEFTRACQSLEVERSMTSSDVIGTLDRLVEECGIRTSPARTTCRSSWPRP